MCIYLLTSICLYFIIIILITEVVRIRGLDKVDIWAANMSGLTLDWTVYWSDYLDMLTMPG